MQHKRPKMTLLQRAKQFMPFAALKGFQELLDETAPYTVCLTLPIVPLKASLHRLHQ